MTATEQLAPPTYTDQLTGKQKAAVFCMTLGSAAAAKLMEGLPPEDVEALSFEIARMDKVPADLVQAVLTEWLGTMEAAETVAQGGLEYAREMLERSFGAKRAEHMLKRIQGQLADFAGLQRLRNADPQQLGSTLRGEHPQTVALILAHLDEYNTAALLKELDPSMGREVIYRMACMERVSPEMLQLIERAFGQEADLTFSGGMSASGGPEAVAAVLNLLNASLEKELLDGLQEKNPELCEQIKNLMFVFEDIITLDERALQRLLREIESRQLALSLKTASDALKEKILGSMPTRAVTALNEEMDYLGPVRLRDVETAQAEIVAVVRKLEEAGEIVLTSGEDDVVV